MTQKTLPIQTSRHKLHKQIIKFCHFSDFPLYFNKVGPKKFTNYQRIGLIILFLRSRKSLRDFTKELCELKWINWLGIRSLPGKSTLHDWLNLFDLQTIRKFLQLTVAEEKPSLMAIDATGIDAWQRSRHYQWRIQEDIMPSVKLDIIVDTKTKLIHDFVLRVKPRHDTLGAKSIFKRMKVKGVKILGDKGYDSEKLHLIAREMGNELFAPVRKMKKGKPNGKFRRMCVEKDPEYGMRNIVENTFKVLKQVRVHALRSKKHYMKKREMGWHIIIYNLSRMERMIQVILWIKEPFRTEPFN